MLYAVLSTGVRVGANLLLVPIVVKRLTASELALWWVFLALGGLASLADFGFGQAICRVYSYLWAGAEDFETEGFSSPVNGGVPNRDLLRRFNVTVRRLYLWLSLAALMALAVGGTVFLRHSTNSTAAGPRFWLAWALFVGVVIYSFGTSFWMLACQGVNRVRELQISNLWGGLTYVVSAATLLLLHCGLWSMVVAFGLRGLLSRQLWRRAYQQAVPVDPAEHLPVDVSMLKRIWPNAWKFGLLSLAVYLINSGPVLICSRYLGAAVTASYGLTSQLGMFLVSFSTLWLTVKWPEITILRTGGRLEQMATLFARRLALAMVTFLIFGALLVLFGNRLLEWKGANTRLLPTPYLVVFLLYLWQQVFYGQFGVLTFTENVVPFYRLASATGVGMILLCLVMAPRYGIWGLILSPLIVAQFGNSWYPVWRGFRGQPLTARQMLRAAFSGFAELWRAGFSTRSTAKAQP